MSDAARRAALGALTAGVVAVTGCGCSGGQPKAAAAQSAAPVTRQTLSQAQLKQAVLGEKDHGPFDITDLGSKPVIDLQDLPSGKPACGNVGLAYGQQTRPAATAQELRGAFDKRDDKYTRPAAPGPLMLDVQAHRYADAQAVIRNLRADLHACPGWHSKDAVDWKVTRYADPKNLGDEAVSYRVVNKTDAKHPRAAGSVFTVARAGSVVLLAMGSVGGPRPELVEAPVRGALTDLQREQIKRLPRQH
ncbi:hypothetical protein G3I40_11470 [Streptomyces sp. SID14478]|uniref:hypothetical protein n=1 Tax=Streptomyces sp. SID14478 TaxID=2706073 RepID=UPI0013D930D2|nr:hypothetical protein [Streptomyces sp. SID14478]NEB75840.1 hypothetical protein [Streptomyces sp. SID14478]